MVVIVFQTELQVAKSSTGDDKFWLGRVIKENGEFYTQTESWRVTKSGDESKHVLSVPKRIHGKNLGKSNETTDEEQAIFDIESDLKKKQDNKYHNFGEKAPQTLMLPMLAMKFEERGHDIKFPCFGQPKLDGERSLSDGKIFWSRKAKLRISEVVAHLQCTLPEGIILDGELILPKGIASFQGTTKAIKKFDPKISPKLEFWVFDLINLKNLNLSFQERYKLLVSLVGNGELPPNIKLVLTRVLNNENEATKFHAENIVKLPDGKTKFEGTMLRNFEGAYKEGPARSKDLQKLKDFKEDEFEIIDVTEGRGSAEDCAIFVCKTDDGHVFNSNPAMTVEEKQELYKERRSLIGKKVTIRYQEYTDGKKCDPNEGCTGNPNNHRVPRFNNAMGIRDDI